MSVSLRMPDRSRECSRRCFRTIQSAETSITDSGQKYLKGKAIRPMAVRSRYPRQMVSVKKNENGENVPNWWRFPLVSFSIMLIWGLAACAQDPSPSSTLANVPKSSGKDDLHQARIHYG